MYKIGEFSELTGVSTKTLRYYDSIGLLKPSIIDNFTNYRYYNDAELRLFKRIEYLKKLGFTLEEIKSDLDNLTIEFLDSKLEELINKRDYLTYQIAEINSLRKKLKTNKVMSLIK